MSDKPADSVDRGTEGPGVTPGLSSLSALRSARRTLADAEARLAALADERIALEREAVTWQQVVDRMRGLIAFYESRLAEPLQLGLGTTTEEGATPNAAPEPGNTERLSVERFGKFVIPVANALIAACGRAVPVEDIYQALPDDVRAELDAGSAVYSTPFRIRRMFRRNKKYRVSGAGVSFAHMNEQLMAPAGATVAHLVRRNDGSIAAIALANDAGEVTNAKPAEVREALRAGQTIMLPEIGGRRSRLHIAGGRFYSEAEGAENRDFFELPEVPENNAG